MILLQLKLKTYIAQNGQGVIGLSSFTGSI